MATIKEQTEKTERLKTTLDNKVIAIADERKKQDNIDITRLSEVPDAIAQLKNSRKRWASGTDSVLEIGTPSSYNCKLLTFPRLDFKPAFICFFDYTGRYFGDRIVMASLREGNFYFYDVVDDSYQGHGIKYKKKVSKTDTVEVGTIIGAVVNFATSSSSKYESQKSVSWIAFE